MALTPTQKNKSKRKQKKLEQAADHLEQKQANKKVKHETGDGRRRHPADEEDIEIEYIAEPLFPSAALSASDDNVIAGEQLRVREVEMLLRLRLRARMSPDKLRADVRLRRSVCNCFRPT